MPKKPARESSSVLDALADKIRKRLDTKHKAREKALPISREVIRFCANAIRAIHRREFEGAEELLKSARSSLDNVKEALKSDLDIFYAGFVDDAQKEYAEASITRALVLGEPLPDPDKLGVGYAPYLNGLGEAVGEMRRYLLDCLRRGEVARCEELLAIMDDLYGILVTMDYPDALTGGLRRTTDVVRGIMEKTRGDLTLALRQGDLEKRLRDLSRKLAIKSSQC